MHCKLNRKFSGLLVTVWHMTTSMSQSVLARNDVKTLEKCVQENLKMMQFFQTPIKACGCEQSLVLRKYAH